MDCFRHSHVLRVPVGFRKRPRSVDEVTEHLTLNAKVVRPRKNPTHVVYDLVDLRLAVLSSLGVVTVLDHDTLPLSDRPRVCIEGNHPL